MGDFILRALTKDAGVRALACVTTGLAQEAARRHAAYPIAAAALAHGLTAGVLLGALLKVQERIALKIEGDGRLRKMVIEADAYGRVRGYVAVPDAVSGDDLGAEAVGEAFGGEGVLTVVKDLRLKDLYRSVVALDTGQLAPELEHYLNASEQIPSLVRIGVRMDEAGAVAASGGLLIQALPGRGREAVERLAVSLADLPPLETLLADDFGPRELLDRIFGPAQYEILEERPVEFRCTCSWERSRQALKMLEPEDLLALLAEGEAVVDCHFCYERYHFSAEDLEGILREREAAE
ncbi:MAG: 33 kDa chaperonin [Chloroflexi bacterium ADurb.Bin325]|nr:MAG: 33 kDa chaperonin [Chloroflexi bacterium ADurb.Bin325]